MAVAYIDANSCLSFLKHGKIPEYFSLGPDGAKRAEELAVHMLKAGKLSRPLAATPVSARVPGALVSRVIDATGIGEARVRAAMRGKGKGSDDCLVDAALIRATLTWQGPERAAILKTL